MKPVLSYTIWFSQRTGSSLLCAALESTGLAGHPGEWLLMPDPLGQYGVTDPAALQRELWKVGSTANGVFGLKHSFHEPHFGRLIEALRQGAGNRVAVWENAFPNHRHIFMTRRNKVRLAVSWWKAIQTGEWARRQGEQGDKAPAADLGDAYSFDGIGQLYAESAMREVGIQEFFSEGRIVPFTIVYEDFIASYEETLRGALEFLGLSEKTVDIPAPPFEQQADEVSEAWVQRFREELQRGWQHRGW